MSISPFGRQENKVFASFQDNFINIEPRLQPSNSLIIGENSMVSPVASPIFINQQNLGTFLADNQSSEQGTALINYTVQKGESLSTIAEKFNISVETILLANELSSSKIIAGQELVILPTSGLIH
ncbi:MAG: LysM peptidoglycan-binding domain-containing protein, partial [Candidatus Pacebacteria bacterium]|nr:LysM peptidoglycan-binding domain-containing protein [Candidatus Paceibacterota bacterium]